jgi:DNA-directed RNA polymerase I subunit RPA49
MPGLTLPKATSFKPFQRPRADGLARRRSSSALVGCELLLNSSEHPKIDYTGHEETADNRLVKHYVGVYDPATGKLQVMEARKLVIRGAVRKEASPEKEQEEEEIQTVQFSLAYFYGIELTVISRAELFVTNSALPSAQKNLVKPLLLKQKMR